MRKSIAKILVKEIIKEVLNQPPLREINMPSPDELVEYVKPFPGAKAFTIEDPQGPQKFELCIGKLKTGKLGLAIYAYRGNFVITVDWFNQLYGNSL